MDGLSGIGTNPYLRSPSGTAVAETPAGRAAPAFVVADMPTRANTSLGGTTQASVRPSLLVALQEMRLNKPTADDEAKEGETESAAISATGKRTDVKTVSTRSWRRLVELGPRGVAGAHPRRRAQGGDGRHGLTRTMSPP